MKYMPLRISPRTKFTFGPLPSGRVCQKCNKPDNMTRTHKGTMVTDTRFGTCFACIPCWNTQFSHRDDRANLLRVDDYFDEPFTVNYKNNRRGE